MGIIGDIEGGIGDVVDATWSVVKDIAGLPGVSDILNLAKTISDDLGLTDLATSIVDGPLRWFANTPVGWYMLNVVTAGISAGLLSAAAADGFNIALTIASIEIYALPGLLAGDDSGKAWAMGFAWRIDNFMRLVSAGYINLDDIGVNSDTVNEVLAAADTVEDAAHQIAAWVATLFNEAVAYLKAYLVAAAAMIPDTDAEVTALKSAGVSLNDAKYTVAANRAVAAEIANVSGLREDIIQMALDAITGKNDALATAYDAITGQSLTSDDLKNMGLTEITTPYT